MYLKNRTFLIVLFIAIATFLIILLNTSNIKLFLVLIIAFIPALLFSLYFGIKDYKSFFLIKTDELTEIIKEGVVSWDRFRDYADAISDGSLVFRKFMSVFESKSDDTIHIGKIRSEIEETLMEITTMLHDIEKIELHDSLFETDPTDDEEDLSFEEDIPQKLTTVRFDRPLFTRRLIFSASDIAI